MNRLLSRQPHGAAGEGAGKAGDTVASRRWPWFISAVLFAFLLGLLGSRWLEEQVRSHIPGAIPAVESADAARIDGMEARVGQLEAGAARAEAAPDAALRSRLEALENRTDSANAAELVARTESLDQEIRRVAEDLAASKTRLADMFLLSVVRRMLESGRPLGEVGGMLSRRYKSEDAAGVEALLAWSAAPQTIDTLAARLKAMDAAPAASKGRGSWWQRFRAGLSGLVTVSGESPGPNAASALAAAQQAMADKDVGLAISTLRSAPADAGRAQWIRDATLQTHAQDALNRLENRALEAASAPLVATEPEQTRPTAVNVAPQNAAPAPQGR